MFGYGPVMLSQTLKASGDLERQGIGLKVVNLPWLNTVGSEWLASIVGSHPWVFTLDDHYIIGGQGDMIMSRFAQLDLESHPKARKLGVDRLPECGSNDDGTPTVSTPKALRQPWRPRWAGNRDRTYRRHHRLENMRIIWSQIVAAPYCLFVEHDTISFLPLTWNWRVQWQLTTSKSGDMVHIVPGWCVFENTQPRLGYTGISRSSGG